MHTIGLIGLQKVGLRNIITVAIFKSALYFFVRMFTVQKKTNKKKTPITITTNLKGNTVIRNTKSVLYVIPSGPGKEWSINIINKEILIY